MSLTFAFRMVTIGGCVFLVFVWYWQTNLTYTAEVVHFEEKVRKQVDPVKLVKLQDWAISIISQHTSSRVPEASFPVEVFPDYLMKLHRLGPSDYVFPGLPEGQAFVRVIWGSGFREHWGLNIGSTNFVDPLRKS